MKTRLVFILFLIIIMTGCAQIKLSEPDLTGYVVHKNDSSLLIVSNVAVDYSSTDGSKEFYDAVSANNTPENVETGDLVEVWYDSIVLESYPAQAEIRSLNIISSEQPEGANLSEPEVISKVLSQYSPEDHPLAVKTVSYSEDQNTWSIVLKNLFDDTEYSHDILDK